MLRTDRRTALDLPAEHESEEPRPPFDWRSLLDRLPTRWVITLAVSWPLLFALGAAIEPSSNPNYDPGLVGNIVETGAFLMMVATAVGVSSRRRWGAVASLAGAFTLLAMTIACPISGHHPGIGAWWFGQLLIAGVLANLSLRAFRSA